ncbi:hypothetical protein BKH43_04665 [Helicobacter sp. 13S00401-1]|nr:hypothetical protein BKH43_04665 [Helicobacter sp. 13S00401-1]
MKYNQDSYKDSYYQSCLVLKKEPKRGKMEALSKKSKTNINPKNINILAGAFIGFIFNIYLKKSFTNHIVFNKKSPLMRIKKVDFKHA